MEVQFTPVRLTALCLLSFLLSSCSTFGSDTTVENLNYPLGTASGTGEAHKKTHVESSGSYNHRLPAHLATGEKTILVDPNVHAWGAYNAKGDLVRSGLVTAGSNYCPDIKRACRTRSGSFRIQSLGSAGCKSTIYPLPKGGAPMPYCMFFNGNQGLHGSYQVVEGNVSHGCVRMRVPDAEWLRFNFATVGTKVIVRPY